MASTLEAVVEGIGDDVLVLLDPNCRPRVTADRVAYLARLKRMLRRADVVKVSADDLEFIALRAIMRQEYECCSMVERPWCCIPMAPAACTFTAPRKSIEVPVPKVDVVDTIGAGDAFGGAFAAWWDQAGLRRRDLGDTVRCRQAVAASVEVAAHQLHARRSATSTARRARREVETVSSMIELTVAEAIDRAANSPPPAHRAGHHRLSGAGKSTLSAAIAAVVPSSVVVPMDGFHLLNEELVRLGRRDRKGAPDTFDVDGYVALLDRVRRQLPARSSTRRIRPRRQRACRRRDHRRRSTAPLVITEGNYLLLDDPPWSRSAAARRGVVRRGRRGGARARLIPGTSSSASRRRRPTSGSCGRTRRTPRWSRLVAVGRTRWCVCREGGVQLGAAEGHDRVQAQPVQQADHRGERAVHRVRRGRSGDRRSPRRPAAARRR